MRQGPQGQVQLPEQRQPVGIERLRAQQEPEVARGATDAIDVVGLGGDGERRVVGAHVAHEGAEARQKPRLVVLPQIVGRQ
eukprot:scaffold1160_cov157-Isochrysis_galbana.AAC.2